MHPRRAALAAASVALMLPAAACGAASQGFHQGVSSKPSSPSPASGTALVLEASAPAGVVYDVNWFPGSGKAQVKNGLTGSWTTSVTAADPRAVNMGVQAESGTGNVTCTIRSGSKVMVTQTKPGSDGANCAYPSS